jgi:hypothetical protein
MTVYSCYSYRKSNIERLLSLTDSFTWEELPTRDPDSGHLTKAGYIPIIQKLTKFLPTFILVFHTIQCAFRVVLNHDMLLTSWYPFDTSESPMYEIVNLTQVKFSLLQSLKLNLFEVYATGYFLHRSQSQVLILWNCREYFKSLIIFQFSYFRTLYLICVMPKLFFIFATLNSHLKYV